MRHICRSLATRSSVKRTLMSQVCGRGSVRGTSRLLYGQRPDGQFARIPASGVRSLDLFKQDAVCGMKVKLRAPTDDLRSQ
jgi:hypothetical protein